MPREAMVIVGHSCNGTIPVWPLRDGALQRIVEDLQLDQRPHALRLHPFGRDGTCRTTASLSCGSAAAGAMGSTMATAVGLSVSLYTHTALLLSSSWLDGAVPWKELLARPRRCRLPKPSSHAGRVPCKLALHVAVLRK